MTEAEDIEQRGARCPICEHRVIWHHDGRGCQFHGNGSRRCPCRRTSDQVVARIVYDAMKDSADHWFTACVTGDLPTHPAEQPERGES